MKLVGCVDGSVKLQVVAVNDVTSDHVLPPLLLTCTFSPALKLPCVPATVSEVTLVMKSVADCPLSGVIAEMATAVSLLPAMLTVTLVSVPSALATEKVSV